MLLLLKLILTFFAITIRGDNSFTTIIIGAGSAGIAAATRLIKNNITDILILEAEDRIGGRINSVQFQDVFVDLGAEWCHGEKDNIVYELVKNLNLLTTSNFNKKLWRSPNEHFNQEIENDIVRTADLFFHGADRQNDERYKNFSVKELFLEIYNKTVVTKYKDDSEKLKILQDGIDFSEHYILGLDCAFDWNDITVNSKYTECEGNQGLYWKGNGYKTIIDILLQKYKNPKKALKINDKILFNKEVTKISWGDETENEIVIHCSDDSKYQSKFVIFTPSLGVLKAQHKTLFSPNLPAEKIQAIDHLGIGAIVKVVLNFTEKWWNDDDSIFFFFWSAEDKAKLLKEFPNDPVDQYGNSWLSSLSLVYRPNDRSNLLTAWFTGSAVPQIEKLSNESILKGCEYALRKFLGNNYKITKPNIVARTSWFSNPHFRGAWSYETVKGSTFRHSLHKILAMPIVIDVVHEKHLLFAGEITHSKYFSTVHGAIETGFREADRVIEALSNQE